MPSLSFSKVVLLATSLGWLPQLANAALPDGRLNSNRMRPPVMPKVSSPGGPVSSRNGTDLPPYDTTYYFDQLIDHDNPGLGTFKQRYWHTYEFYEPGGPIILMTPGEVNAYGYDGYLTTDSINGLISQQQNGSTVLLEHRFYGDSNPYPDLSVKSLQFHTLHQAVNDLAYFAKNVHLPMPGGDKVAPGQAPWILVGGSYSGALTAWTMTSQKDVFFAGYASSAVVQATTDLWGYFDIIRQFMPKNCSADVEAVISEVDRVLTSSDDAQIAALKNNFGMGDVTHLDDVADALQSNLFDWQDLQPSTGDDDRGFYDFCDALEVGDDGKLAPAEGFGLQHALTAWGSYWNNTYLLALCDDTDVGACFDSYTANQTSFTSEEVNNSDRSWNWIVCNEVGYFRDSPPLGQPTIVSRLIQPIYDERQCQLMFPAAFNSPPAPRVQETNTIYHGWNVTVDRLFFANGLRDPWRDATVSADGTTTQSTDLQPVAVSNGFHTSDLVSEFGRVDSSIGKVQKQALAAFKTWLATWKPSAIDKQGRSPRFVPNGQALPRNTFVKPVNAWAKGAGRF